MNLLKKKSGNGTWHPQYIYVLYNFPYIWVTKIGITGYPDRRISDIRESSPGTDYYLFKTKIVGAYYLEQLLHVLFIAFRIKWSGSGYTERFLSIVAIPAIILIILAKLIIISIPFGFLYLLILILSGTV